MLSAFCILLFGEFRLGTQLFHFKPRVQLNELGLEPCGCVGFLSCGVQQGMAICHYDNNSSNETCLETCLEMCYEASHRVTN